MVRIVHIKTLKLSLLQAPLTLLDFTLRLSDTKRFYLSMRMKGLKTPWFTQKLSSLTLSLPY